MLYSVRINSVKLPWEDTYFGKRKKKKKVQKGTYDKLYNF